MRVTVVIPTRNRPDMFSIALAKVLEQDKDLIERIVVSDVSDNDDTRQVVESFRSSLVHYEKISPPVHEPCARFRGLYSHGKTEFLAISCDDDWWHPGHLAYSVKSLDAHPDLLLSGASHLCWNPARARQRTEHGCIELISEICSSELSDPAVVLRKADVFAFCLLGGFFHYSTLVFRHDFVARMEETWTPELMAFDSDRFQLAVAGKSGGALFLNSPSATVKYHSLQEGNLQVGIAKRSGIGVSQFITQDLNEDLLHDLVAQIEKVGIACLGSPNSKLARHVGFMHQWLQLPPELVSLTPKYQKFVNQTVSRSLLRRILGKIRS